MSEVASSLGGMPDATRPLPDLVLGDAVVDRDALRRSEPDLIERLLAVATTRVLDVRGASVPQRRTQLLWRAPQAEDRQWFDTGGVVLYLGQTSHGPALAVLRPQDDAPVPAPTGERPGDAATATTSEDDGDDAPSWRTLRDIGLELSGDDLACVTAAVALAQWHATHTHCPRCGALTIVVEAGWVRRCEADGSHHFPRTDPAVIMAIVDESDPDDSRLLLARGPRWKGPHRSVLAGFVEPGESFEQAVARETFEESGVEVTDVRYLGSQPWPFPASLMIGCIARAVTTPLRAQEGEIEEIGWYSRADVRQGLADGSLALPGRLSIARALIEHWYGEPLP